MTEAIEKVLKADMRKEFEKSTDAMKEELERERASLTAERTSIEKEVLKRVDTNRRSMEAAAKAAAEAELVSVREELGDQTAKLREAQNKEIELRKQQRALEQEKNEFQLKLTRELDAERSKIVEETSRKVSEDYSMKELEWAKHRADLMKQMDEMRRKAEQGSQQAQGEAFELAVEEILKEAFVHDSIEPVAKGVTGGDILQVVNTKTGARCGAIVWELKNTKAFSEGWVQKLKDNQREAKADLAVIVTKAMPAGVERIGQVDGVWVVDLKSMMGLALALRASLVEIAQAKRAQAGRKEKAEEVWDYINGPEFRGRMQAIVELFVTMKEDLDSERRSIEKTWAKREKLLMRAIGSSAGMYGDFQGLVGSSLPEIKALSMETA